MDFISNIITAIGNAYPAANVVYAVIGTVLAWLAFHKTIYRILGFFFTRKFKPAKQQHKYAVVIAARNEQAVIGNLLDSIKQQDYPQELLTVFVVADNCTDKTAEAARQKGAVCYERFDKKRKTKGYALQYLFECIERDYGTKSFEGNIFNLRRADTTAVAGCRHRVCSHKRACEQELLHLGTWRLCRG